MRSSGQQVKPASGSLSWKVPQRMPVATNRTGRTPLIYLSKSGSQTCYPETRFTLNGSSTRRECAESGTITTAPLPSILVVGALQSPIWGRPASIVTLRSADWHLFQRKAPHRIPRCGAFRFPPPKPSSTWLVGLPERTPATVRRDPRARRTPSRHPRGLRRAENARG